MIDTSTWKEFRIDEVFRVRGGFFNKKPEHSEEGDIPFLAATDSNNGVTEYYSWEDIRSWDKVGNPDNTLDKKVFEAPAIAVTVNGACCSAFYQPVNYTCSHDITSLTPLDGHALSEFQGLFCCTVIEQEKYRWSYGRKPHDVAKLSAMIIRLPATIEGKPDWEYMESFIDNLHSRKAKTAISQKSRPFSVDDWKEYRLNELYDITTGDGYSRNAMTEYEPSVNFVSRISFGNGVVGRVDKLDGIEPHPAGLMTIALGGSYLGSAFVQLQPFYTAAHMSIATPKYPEMSLFVQLFIATLIRKEARSKYCAFGRELDTHINREFSVKLPVDDFGNPDWIWMEQYMKSLPYSDRLLDFA